MPEMSPDNGPMNLTGQPIYQPVKPFKSDTLRRFAKGRTCALAMPWCTHDTETTVLCHVRFYGSAGMAQKPHDFFAFHGCSECHRREKDAGWDDILRAMMETQRRVYAEFGTLTP